MPNAILRHFYETYARGYLPGRTSWLHNLHRKIVRSPRIVRVFFGMKVVKPEKLDSFFCMTTVCMKGLLRRRLRQNPDLRMLEIGAGTFAILCGHLSRYANHRIQAIEVDPNRAANSQRHLDMNHMNVGLTVSDLFANAPPGPYDAIFWNLPYYDDSVYLDRLFAAAPDYMTPTGQLILGHNTNALSRQTILDFLSRYPSLRLIHTETWWWNLHEVQVVGKS